MQTVALLPRFSGPADLSYHRGLGKVRRWKGSGSGHAAIKHGSAGQHASTCKQPVISAQILTAKRDGRESPDRLRVVRRDPLVRIKEPPDYEVWTPIESSADSARRSGRRFSRQILVRSLTAISGNATRRHSSDQSGPSAGAIFACRATSFAPLSSSPRRVASPSASVNIKG